MRSFDERVGRLPKWARAYIEGLEARIERSETPLKIEAGVVHGFVLTRNEVKAARLVADSQLRREVLEAHWGKKGLKG